ncbi:uncharacterized protein LOC131214591, partial [Anopheles bellator]|uniref:uncharacterized protein LOC131214591 n=1 Tax=Anopheles bellator TaxID=139047 RepID=UPI0026490102
MVDAPNASAAAGQRAALTIQTPIIEPFDRHRTKWTRWVERLETAFTLFLVPEDRKLLMLLHYIGSENYDIVADKLAPVKPHAKTYAEIVKLLQEHFTPKPLEILENFRFKCCKQGEESIDDYLLLLKKLAITCNFGDYLNTALRNQFVFGLKNRGIQARLLEVRDLTLDKAHDLAVAMEMSARGGDEIQGQEKNDIWLLRQANKSTKGRKPMHADRLDKGGTNTSTTACYRCGNTQHLANKCAHVNTICHACKKTGHISKVCLKKQAAPVAKKYNAVHSVEDKKDLDEICGLYNTESRIGKFWADISVNGKCIKFEVDTGAPVAIISLEDFKKTLPSLKLTAADLTLISYSGDPVKLQ